MVSEATRNSLSGSKIKICQRSMPPDPPSLGMLPHTRISPLYEKILYACSPAPHVVCGAGNIANEWLPYTNIGKL